MWHKATGEEGEYLVTGGDGWVAGFVDQVLGDYAVWALNSCREKRCDVGVGRAVREHTSHEAISERSHVRGETLRSAKPVSLEAISQNSKVFPREPVADRTDIFGRDLSGYYA